MPNKFDGQKATFRIKDVQEELKEGVRKVVLVAEDGKKYRFSDKTKQASPDGKRPAGSPTKAYQQYVDEKVAKDMVVEVAYKEVSGTGNDGPYTNNYISWFEAVYPEGSMIAPPEAGKVPTIVVDEEMPF